MSATKGMPDRVVMDVIDMRVKISFIPDQVFPVAILPNGTRMPFCGYMAFSGNERFY